MASDPEVERWGNHGSFEDADEKRVVFAVLDSFFQYAKIAHYNTTHLRRQSFYALPSAHWELLAAPPFSFLDTLNAVDDAIDKIAELAIAILRCGVESLGLPLHPEEPKDGVKHPDDWRGSASAADLDKARSTLRQFYRDWSAEGAAEREVCFAPVMSALQSYSNKSSNGSPLSVLVPGAGLGRLVFEICTAGYNVEGNEISYHQLLASSYILNYCPGPEYHTIYPWAHTFSNHKSRANHLQAIKVPDIHPGHAMASTNPGEMSMSAADFVMLYHDDDHQDTYDAVATVFFLDTAPNPIRYIETIRRCLKPGGIWINIGPLLWHFENDAPGSHGKSSEDGIGEAHKQGGIEEPGSVELTEDEVLLLVEKLGFVIEKHVTDIETGYIQDDSSMIQNMYKASHWVARKA